MGGNTLQTRSLQLLQKSRQAFRLYARSDGRSYNQNIGAAFDAADLQEIQKQEWRNVNAELIRTLGRILDVTTNKHLAHELFGLRESFLHRYRESQAALRIQQDNLLSATERGDFLAIPKIGVSLITLKSLGQAQQAALHELDALLGSHKQSVHEDKESDISETRTQARRSGSAAGLRGGIANTSHTRAGGLVQARPTAKIIPLRRVGSK